MIDLNDIDIQWIEKISKSNRRADMTLVEKTIRAFVLLEGLGGWDCSLDSVVSQIDKIDMIFLSYVY